MTKNGEQHNPAGLPVELIRLGSYKWPRSETRQTLGHLYEKIKIGLLPDFDKDAVDTQKLKSVSDEPFKESVGEVLAETLCDMLDQKYLQWARSPNHTIQRRALVHPPMDRDPLFDWAKLHDLPVLNPGDNLDGFADAACVVIPRLDSFSSRDHSKIAPLFDLFADLASFKGKLIVGCNSWAWRYLKQFDDALLLFGQADTFPAFDADALANLLENAQSKNSSDRTFTSVTSGKPILARDDDGILKDSYLENLAGRSLGHPWVSVEMIFRGIAETEDKENASPADSTWVDLPAACSLPTSGADALFFALHTLMIHGARPPIELNELLPHRVPNGTWTELERIGFVDVHDGRVHCAIRSYPDIRSELGAAGFNLDEL